MSYLIMENVDQKKYDFLMQNLNMQNSFKDNKYLKTITDAINALGEHRHDNYN